MQTSDHPQLRPGLRFVRQESGGTVAWVVKDPARQKYFRFGQVEAWLMQRMDGSRSLQQICDELLEEIGVRATPAGLDVLVRRLRELGLVERSVEERCALMLEQMRTQRRLRRENDNTLLRMRFSFGDWDDVMGRTVAFAPFFWTRGFVIASLLAFASYVFIVVWYWTPFVHAMTIMVDPARVTLPLLLLSYTVITLVSIVHELGHGLTCKRFGGEVREMGAMMLYFMPAFYCNISDAWTFDKRGHRLWVTFAGGWIELWIAVCAAFVWLFTEPGTFINTLAAVTSATAGALSLLMNYNPLMPFDGYYALVDWLEIPNLRGRSFAHVGAVFKRSVLRLDTPLPPATEREQRIFLWYGIGASLYSLFILCIVAWFAGRLLMTNLGAAWGGVLFVLLLAALTRAPRAAVARAFRVFVAEKLPRQKLRRGIVAGLLLIVVSGAIVGFTPWTVRSTVPAIVEPAARVWLRPEQRAVLTEVRVTDGDGVRAGDTLAVLRSPELELARLAIAADLHEAGRRAAAAAARGDARAARSAGEEHAAYRSRLDVLERSRSSLVLRAPFDGVVVTPRLVDRLGETLAGGDSLIEVWRAGPVRARIVASQSAGGELAAGSTIRIRFAAHPGLTWKSSIESVETSADNDRVIAIAPLAHDTNHVLLPGMIGRARVDVRHTTIADALVRSARRVIRLDLLL